MADTMSIKSCSEVYKLETERKPKFYIGLIVFFAVVAFLIFGASHIQAALGVYGLFVTEVIILVIALIPVLLFKYDIRKVFPIKRPSARQIFGVLMLWYGALQLGSLCIYVTMYFFPEGMTDVAWALRDFFAGAPLPVILICAAVMPAICEEALCRGLIQHSFGGIKIKWVVILLVGLLFGILHLDFYRFLPTMILGIALAYIMAETGNLLLPMIFHFVNNACSTFLSWLTGPLTESIKPDDLAGIGQSTIYIGGALFMVAVIPWLFIYGSRLVKHRKAQAEDGEAVTKRVSVKTIIAAAIISAACIVGGIALIIPGMSGLLGSAMQPILDISYTEKVSAESAPDQFPVTIEESGQYMLSYQISGDDTLDSGGQTAISFTGSDGHTYLDLSAGEVFGNVPVQLVAGNYTLTFEYDYGYAAGSEKEMDVSFKIVSLTPKLPFAYETEVN
jgi:membrane protease YdiL (CAAX protease family)